MNGRERKRQGCRPAVEACDSDRDRLLIGGEEFYRCMTSGVNCRDEWGEREPQRGSCRPKGEYDGSTVAPLELRAGIVEGSRTREGDRETVRGCR